MGRVSHRLRAIARDTVAIVRDGGYRTAGGDRVDIAERVAAAVAGTRLYLPDAPLPEPAGDRPAPTAVRVTNSSSLAAARELGGDVACLVFASARNPGGGFRNGAQAQEESLARSSALYACLTAVPEFYTHHRSRPELTYSDRVIYSPAVPVFRDDRAALLPAPYPVTFLTAAAPNLAAIVRGQPALAGEVPAILRRRAARVLAVAAAHGHRRLVLGAWGCGVFGNDPAVVADAFRAALAGRPELAEVVFAVLDTHRGAPTHAAFAAAFESDPPGQTAPSDRAEPRPRPGR
jgi:uncharacterized protein (TIGR02452 family)